MANEILIKFGTPIVWADTTDFGDSPIARTVQIDLTSLANAAARQGVKVDFGANRADRFAVTLRAELDVAASATPPVINLHFAPSPHTTAGTANPGGASGADAAYTGTAGDSIANSLNQCDYIGSLYCTADAAAVVQQQSWIYSPPERYGSPIVFNQSGQAFEGDANEMSIIFQPIIDEIQ